MQQEMKSFNKELRAPADQVDTERELSKARVEPLIEECTFAPGWSATSDRQPSNIYAFNRNHLSLNVFLPEGIFCSLSFGLAAPNFHFGQLASVENLFNSFH